MKALELINAVRDLSSKNLPEIKTLRFLAQALGRFARENRRKIISLVDCLPGAYTSHLLNAREDNFRVVLIFWGAGSKSSIHDHAQTIGAVMPVAGVIHETKYEVVHLAGREAVLSPLATVPLEGASAAALTPIVPEASTQVHLLANHTNSWAATMHAYLSPLSRFHAFLPNAGGAYTLKEKTAHYERDNEWRRLDNNESLMGGQCREELASAPCLHALAQAA